VARVGSATAREWNRAPSPWRWEELRYLARALNIPPIFGEEVTGITQEMMKEMSESSES
jgi:hypothetical protein